MLEPLLVESHGCQFRALWHLVLGVGDETVNLQRCCLSLNFLPLSRIVVGHEVGSQVL